MEIASEDVVALQKLRCDNGVMNTNSIRSLSDAELLRDIETASARERGATVDLIALLAEVDARRLYLPQGYSSLFTYCTTRLHLSEHAAYGRIEAARTSRKFPRVLDRLGDGSITLTTICLLSNHLTRENHEHLLDAARHKTRREVEQLVAALRPEVDVPPSVRRLPGVCATAVNMSNSLAIDTTAPSMTSATGELTPKPAPTARPSVPASVHPLAPERYRVQFTIGADTHWKLRTLQDLLRHPVPTGDIAEIFDRALTLLLREVERRKLAQSERPRAVEGTQSRKRYVPAVVKRAVWARDRGQCAFVGVSGRCQERGFLEFHHVIPFADGGPTTIENLHLRCRAHNSYEAGIHPDVSLVRERWL